MVEIKILKRKADTMLKFCGFFLLIVISCIQQCHGQCELLPPARWDLTVREKQLFERIEPLKGKMFKAKDALSPESYDYEVGICGGFQNFTGAIQRKETTKETHVIGRYNMSDIMGGTEWVLLTYYGGDKTSIHTDKPSCNGTERTTKIMIVCDPDVLEGELKVLEERKSTPDSCFYLFELSSNVACKKPSSKLSSGSVFCILLFTGICVYLLCGFLYQRIVVGAKGLEQIPNYSFWRAFGNLTADGCDFICRCGPRNEAQAYRGIDDPMKEEERDDQLLNMGMVF